VDADPQSASGAQFWSVTLSGISRVWTDPVRGRLARDAIAVADPVKMAEVSRASPAP
jgi:hypothetical protein